MNDEKISFAAVQTRRSDSNRLPLIRFAACLLCAASLLAGCESMVAGTISAANRADDAREAAKDKEIVEQALKRYRSLANEGDPLGYYYLAVAHAVRYDHKPDGDVHEVKRLYEDAVARGSNDAKVALGLMLVEGHTHPFVLNRKLPKNERDPVRGMALLKSAAEQSCHFMQPLVAIGRCRERLISTPVEIWIIYRDGRGGIAKDPEQARHWKTQTETCDPVIQEENKLRGCFN
jgi:TPR repeat protein